MKSLFFGAATFVAAAALYACSTKTTTPPATVRIPSDEAGGHTSAYPSCNAITEACHEFDVGEGELHECHELGHDSVSDEPCAAQKVRCLALCADAGAMTSPQDAGSDGDAARDAGADASKE